MIRKWHENNGDLEPFLGQLYAKLSIYKYITDMHSVKINVDCFKFFKLCWNSMRFYNTANQISSVFKIQILRFQNQLDDKSHIH